MTATTMNHDKPIILLIDDDPTLVEMYSFKFNRDGFCVFLTADGTIKALQIAESEQPDLVLLDLILPKEGGLPSILNKEVGFHLLGLLKSNPKTKNIPVVVFSNLDERNHNNVQRAKKLGALDYWVKAHYKPSEVLEKVKAIIQ